MADRSTCLSPACGYSVEGRLSVCPKCGWGMSGPFGIRVRGWFLLVFGLILVLFMGAITWAVAPSLLHPGKEAGGMTFNATAEDAQMVLGLFGLVILVGIFSMVNGGYMVARGRPNRLMALATIAFTILLVAVGWAINNALA